MPTIDSLFKCLFAHVTGIRKVLEDEGLTGSPFMHFLVFSESERNLQYHRWSLSVANSGYSRIVYEDIDNEAWFRESVFVGFQTQIDGQLTMWESYTVGSTKDI